MTTEITMNEMPAETPRFGAWKGIALVAILLGGQLVGSIIGGIVYAFYIAATQGQEAVQALTDAEPTPAMIAVIALTSTLISAALFVWISIWWARPLLRESASHGVALATVPNRTAGIALATGLLMCALAVATMNIWPADLESLDGPLVTMAQGGFWVQVALVLFAVVYAPLAEEYIFRGVLFAAFRRSWGIWPAGIAVTLLFTALHAADKLDYLPGFALVFLLGIVALVLRLRYQSLLPAIAMHFVYNLSVFIADAAGLVPTA